MSVDIPDAFSPENPETGESITQQPFAELKALHEQEVAQAGLLEKEGGRLFVGESLVMQLDEGYIAYNISQPFSQVVDGQTRPYLAARVEAERLPGQGAGLPSSQTKFFYKSLDDHGAEVWLPDESVGFSPDDNYEPFESWSLADGNLIGKPTYEDPSVMIDEDGYLVMSRVVAQLVKKVVTAQDKKTGLATDHVETSSTYHQEVWGGSSLADMKYLTRGRDGQKGSRLTSLGGGRYALMNRPQSSQGEEFALGRICYTEFTISSEEGIDKSRELQSKLSDALLDTKTIIPGLCADTEWVGPNQLWTLVDPTSGEPRVGVIGHIAGWLNKTTQEREYCAISFVYNPLTNEAFDIRIIATKADFPRVTPRPDRSDLDNVVYPGGAELVGGDNIIMLYLGISDHEAGCIEIPDPFAEYRAKSGTTEN